MKYLIYLTSLFFFTGLAAQKSWTFTHEMAPQTQYQTDMQMDMKMNMLMNMPEEMKEQMGEALPDTMKMDMMMFFGMGVQTMDKAESGLSFTMTYDSIAMEMAMNGEDMPVPPGSTDMLKGVEMKGRYQGSEMHIDSMAGVAITPEMMAAMESNLQGVQTMIDFPDRPLMIGDTFSQINTQQVSAGAGGNMGVKVLWTLELKAVKGDIATFHTTEVYDFNGAEKNEMVINGTGNGTGVLLFDRKESRIVEYINDSEMDMAVDMSAQVGTEMKMVMLTKNRVVITNKIVE